MDLLEIAVSAQHAFALLAAFPFTWLILVLGFLVLVESLMFVPYIGFISKLCVASLVAAQTLVLFAAASAGEPPQLGDLLGIFTLPLSAQLVLIISALIPFLAGMGYLVSQGGVESLAFFFGNILKTKPPTSRRFIVFKGVMYATALPFTFVAAAITLRGLSGWNALDQALLAAMANWPALLVLFSTSMLFEWSVGHLPRLLPRRLGAALAVALLLAFLAWSLAFAYTLSVRAMPDLARHRAEQGLSETSSFCKLSGSQHVPSSWIQSVG